MNAPIAFRQSLEEAHADLKIFVESPNPSDAAAALDESLSNLQVAIREERERQGYMNPATAELQEAYMVITVSKIVQSIPEERKKQTGAVFRSAWTAFHETEHMFKEFLRRLNSSTKAASTILQILWPGGVSAENYTLFQLPYILYECAVKPPQKSRKRRRLLADETTSKSSESWKICYCYFICELAWEELYSDGQSLYQESWDRCINILAEKQLRFSTAMSTAKAIFLLDRYVEKQGRMPDEFEFDPLKSVNELVEYGFVTEATGLDKYVVTANIMERLLVADRVRDDLLPSFRLLLQESGRIEYMEKLNGTSSNEDDAENGKRRRDNDEIVDAASSTPHARFYQIGYPFLVDLQVLMLLFDRKSDAITLAADMAKERQIADVEKQAAFRSIFNYLLGEGVVLPTPPDCPSERLELIFVPHAGELAISTFLDALCYFADCVEQHNRASAEEKDYIKKACHQAAIRLLRCKYVVSDNVPQPFKLDFPELDKTQLDQWLVKYPKESNPCPASLQSIDGLAEFIERVGLVLPLASEPVVEIEDAAAAFPEREPNAPEVSTKKQDAQQQLPRAESPQVFDVDDDGDANDLSPAKIHADELPGGRDQLDGTGNLQYHDVGRDHLDGTDNLQYHDVVQPKEDEIVNEEVADNDYASPGCEPGEEDQQSASVQEEDESDDEDLVASDMDEDAEYPVAEDGEIVEEPTDGEHYEVGDKAEDAINVDYDDSDASQSGESHSSGSDVVDDDDDGVDGGEFDAEAPPVRLGIDHQHDDDFGYDAEVSQDNASEEEENQPEHGSMVELRTEIPEDERDNGAVDAAFESQVGSPIAQASLGHKQEEGNEAGLSLDNATEEEANRTTAQQQLQVERNVATASGVAHEDDEDGYVPEGEISQEEDNRKFHDNAKNLPAKMAQPNDTETSVAGCIRAEEDEQGYEGEVSQDNATEDEYNILAAQAGGRTTTVQELGGDSYEIPPPPIRAVEKEGDPGYDADADGKPKKAPKPPVEHKIAQETGYSAGESEELSEAVHTEDEEEKRQAKGLLHPETSAAAELSTDATTRESSTYKATERSTDGMPPGSSSARIEVHPSRSMTSTYSDMSAADELTTGGHDEDMGPESSSDVDLPADFRGSEIEPYYPRDGAGFQGGSLHDVARIVQGSSGSNAMHAPERRPASSAVSVPPRSVAETEPNTSAQDSSATAPETVGDSAGEEKNSMGHFDDSAGYQQDAAQDKPEQSTIVDHVPGDGDDGFLESAGRVDDTTASVADSQQDMSIETMTAEAGADTKPSAVATANLPPPNANLHIEETAENSEALAGEAIDIQEKESDSLVAMSSGPAANVDDEEATEAFIDTEGVNDKPVPGRDGLAMRQAGDASSSSNEHMHLQNAAATSKDKEPDAATASLDGDHESNIAETSENVAEASDAAADFKSEDVVSNVAKTEESASTTSKDEGAKEATASKIEDADSKIVETEGNAATPPRDKAADVATSSQREDAASNIAETEEIAATASRNGAAEEAATSALQEEMDINYEKKAADRAPTEGADQDPEAFEAEAMDEPLEEEEEEGVDTKWQPADETTDEMTGVDRVDESAAAGRAQVEDDAKATPASGEAEKGADSFEDGEESSKKASPAVNAPEAANRRITRSHKAGDESDTGVSVASSTRSARSRSKQATPEKTIGESILDEEPKSSVQETDRKNEAEGTPRSRSGGRRVDHSDAEGSISSSVASRRRKAAAKAPDAGQSDAEESIASFVARRRRRAAAKAPEAGQSDAEDSIASSVASRRRKAAAKSANPEGSDNKAATPKSTPQSTPSRAKKQTPPAVRSSPRIRQRQLQLATGSGSDADASATSSVASSRRRGAAASKNADESEGEEKKPTTARKKRKAADDKPPLPPRRSPRKSARKKK